MPELLSLGAGIPRVFSEAHLLNRTLASKRRQWGAGRYRCSGHEFHPNSRDIVLVRISIGLMISTVQVARKNLQRDGIFIDPPGSTQNEVHITSPPVVTKKPCFS